MLLLFPPQSAGRIRAIYFFLLSAPFAMLVYNPLVKYERGSSSTACALRQRYLLYCLLTVCRTIAANAFAGCIIIFSYKVTYKNSLHAAFAFSNDDVFTTAISEFDAYVTIIIWIVCIITIDNAYAVNQRQIEFNGKAAADDKRTSC